MALTYIAGTKLEKVVGKVRKKKMFVRSKFFVVTAVCLVVGFLQSTFYIASYFPDALRDLLLNQGLAEVDSAPKREHALSERGRKVMGHSKAAFIGVGKSLQPQHIATIFTQIDTLSEQFADYHALLIVDEPSPILEGMLREWADADPSRRESMRTAPNSVKEWNDHVDRPLPREGRIAAARNTGLAALQRSGFQPDYVMALDLDILGWDQGGVEDSFGQHDQWDAVCSNGVILHGVYRDVYAFRAPGVNTNHHLSGLDAPEFNVTASEQLAHRTLLHKSKSAVHKLLDGRGTEQQFAFGNLQLHVPAHLQARYLRPPSELLPKSHESSLVQADSCFGGMAIYKAAAIADCDYDYQHRTSPYVVDCEHVLYHQCMRQKHKTRIVSNRNMKLWYGHTTLSSVSYKKAVESLWEYLK